MISINSNHAASMANLNLYKTNSELESSLKKLSSGSRISNPSDDAGGLAVSMKMSALDLQLSGLEKNLANAQSFLETQEGALRVLSKILTRMSELETLKKDVTKNAGDIENYDKEIHGLQAEVVKIREEKFNGIRLFSPNRTADSIQVGGFPLNDSVIDVVRPPLPESFQPNKSIEVVFVVDVSGSMGGTTASIKSNIESLVSDLEAAGQPWKVKVISYSDITEGEAIEVSDWSTDLASITAALNSTLSLKGGGDLPESLIDGLAEAINGVDWTLGGNTFRNIIAFTDAPSKLPEAVSGDINSIAGSAKSKEITINLYGSTTDSVTIEFSDKSGATLRPFSESSDMGRVFSELVDSLYVEPLEFNLEIVSNFMAQNGASQSAIHHLAESVTITKNNLQQANSRIKDVDVASESTQLARLQILQQAGTSMLSQANTSQQTILQLLQG